MHGFLMIFEGFRSEKPLCFFSTTRTQVAQQGWNGVLFFYVIRFRAFNTRLVRDKFLKFDKCPALNKCTVFHKVKMAIIYSLSEFE